MINHYLSANRQIMNSIIQIWNAVIRNFYECYITSFFRFDTDKEDNAET